MLHDICLIFLKLQSIVGIDGTHSSLRTSEIKYIYWKLFSVLRGLRTFYRYNKTNVMHFSFNLWRIRGLYMFRALLAHPQETLHIRHLVYCVHFMSVGLVPQPTDIKRTQCTKCRLRSVTWGCASNARNMYRPLILNKLNEKCITLVSLYWYTMMYGQQNIKLKCYLQWFWI
jgi:hypothetical protein